MAVGEDRICSDGGKDTRHHPQQELSMFSLVCLSDFYFRGALLPHTV